MTIEKARSLPAEEFARSDEESGGSDNGTCGNRQIRDGEETIYDFIKKGGGKMAGFSIPI